MTRLAMQPHPQPHNHELPIHYWHCTALTKAIAASISHHSASNMDYLDFFSLLILLVFLLPAQSAFASSSSKSHGGVVDARHDKVQSDTKRVRFRGRIAYDSTGYDGWQVQPKRRTVQGELESVLSRRFNRPIKTVGAGRTDAGVHARGQAFHFELEEGEIETKEDELKLQRSLNSMLRRDTRVWNVGRAPKAVKKVRDDGSAVVHRWHVIYESTKKLYSYRYGMQRI